MSDEEKGTPTPEEEKDITLKNEEEREEFEEEEIDEDFLDENDEKDKQIKSLLAQKKHFRDKTEKLKQEVSALKQKVEVVLEDIPPVKKEPARQAKSKDQDELLTKIAKLEIKNLARDRGEELDGEDLEHLFKLAKGYEKDPAEMLADPMFKAYRSNKKQEKSEEGANIHSSQRTKQPEKKYSKEQLIKLAQKNPQRYQEIMKEQYSESFEDYLGKKSE